MMSSRLNPEVFSECKLCGEKIVVENNFHKILEYSKSISYDLLKSITAVDLGNDTIELIYNLYSKNFEEDLIFSINIQHEAESITDIFDSAAADENEIFDMFGVNFLNNANLKRLYMPEDWQGHPLKKDYVQNDTRLAWNDNKNS